MPRPLMQLGVGALEALFGKSKTDPKVLKQLEHELQHRQVPRAVALLAEVRAAMHGAPAVSPPPPARAPQQSGLWERPAAPAAPPLTPSVPPTRPATTVKALEPTVATKPSQSPAPVMPLEDAQKLLKATPGSTWDSIEQTRRQLVQLSHPARLISMSAERRAQALAEAKRVNAAYATLSQARGEGR